MIKYFIITQRDCNYPRSPLVMTDRMTHCRTQLQLVGAVCLLVSWKVRGHSPITAQRLIEYTDYTITLPDLLVSLLSQLPFSLHNLAVIITSFCVKSPTWDTLAQRKENTERRGERRE